MKITTILEYEVNNKNGIFLFQEGCFFRAYNRSAMRFVSQIKSIKILKKYIKYIDEKIFYCGFPKNYLEDVLKFVKKKGLKIEKLDKNLHILEINTSKEDYLKWKTQIKSEKKTEKKQTLENLILQKIKNYPLNDKTPNETIKFLYGIQEIL
jgi:hypothetical protein